jgi:hypothetical protein
MTLPMIKILNGPTTLQQGAADASAAGLSTVFSALSHAVDLAPHAADELLQFLRFRTAVTLRAKERSQSFFGRFYNRFAGEDPDYIEMSGTHLKQTLIAAGKDIPPVIAADGEYKLRLDVASAAIANLRQRQHETG